MTAPTIITTTPTAADIRAWANDNGYQVGTRGRLSAEVREAYKAAHIVYEA